MGSLKNKKSVCVVCGKVSDTWNTDVRTKRFCSRKCNNEYNYNLFINLWLNNEIDGSRGSGQLSRHVMRWVHERADNKCELCGFDKVHPRTGNSILEIHHVDENPENNRPENLKLLCPNCHALADSRNSAKGNGRRYYRQKYRDEVK